MNNIKFSIQKTELIREEWIFYNIHNGEWILDYFKREIRGSARHKYKIFEFYSRLNKRESNINVNQIAITRDIEMRLLAEVVKQFIVSKEKIQEES